MPPRRFAILRTPRAGKIRLRALPATPHGPGERAVHHPRDLDDGRPPVRPPLRRHGAGPSLARPVERAFRAVAAACHPLEVPSSILRFTPREPEAARVLEPPTRGEG